MLQIPVLNRRLEGNSRLRWDGVGEREEGATGRGKRGEIFKERGKRVESVKGIRERERE